MIHPEISIDDAIAVLNGMMESDPNAATALVEQRVPCNGTLRDHPTIQVHVEDGQASVGFLGVLNGLFGEDEDGWGPIAARFDDDGTLIRFERSQAKV